MMHILLNRDLVIRSVSKDFLELFGRGVDEIEGCFFMSMVDCNVPDQLAEDLDDSLKKGLMYNSVLRFNVLKEVIWLEIAISPYFEAGIKNGFNVRLSEVDANTLASSIALYKKIENGVLKLKQGWPVENNSAKLNQNQIKWSNRTH